MPTDWGSFNIKAYSKSEDNHMPHIVLASPNINVVEAVYVRIHSECITGDLFHSNRCDCGAQLDKSMQVISEKGGLLIYLRQEGRGIGIINKLKAYNKQDEGYNTIEANLMLGFDADLRDFKDALEILEAEGVKKIKLLTNNPQKIKAFDNSNIELIERVALETLVRKENEAYLKTKKDKLGHLFSSF